MPKGKNSKENITLREDHKTAVDQLATRPAKSTYWGAIAIIFLTTFALYWNTYSFEYVLDDSIVLSENNYVKEGLSGIGNLLTTESFEGYFGEQKNLVEGARYRPLSLITFAIEHQIYGLRPDLSHIINVLFYALAGILLFITIGQFFKDDRKKNNTIWTSVAFITSIIFILHPLHVEAVANIKGRDEILAFIGSMGTLYYGLKYYDTKKWTSLILMLVIFFIGLLAKENTITFLAIIPLSIYFFRKNSAASAVKILGILLIPTILYLLLRYSVIGYFLSNGNEITDVMNNPFAAMRMDQKFATIFYTLGVYLKLHIFPHPLTHDYYPYHIPIVNWSELKAIIPLILHLILGGVAIYGIRSKKIYAYCILFYIAALSIVSNLVVGVGTFMNERFVFTASLGFCLLIGYYIHIGLTHKKFKLISLAIASIFLIGFTYKTISRVPAWKTPLSLNTAASRVSVNSARINSFMATALFNTHMESTDREEKKELLDRAEVFARKSISILPRYKNGNLMLAGIATEQFNFDRDLTKLLGTFRTVIQERPDIDHLRNYMDYLNEQQSYAGQMVNFYQDIAHNILIPQGKIDWALHFLTFGFNIDQNDNRILDGIAKCYEARGDINKATQFRNRIIAQ